MAVVLSYSKDIERTLTEFYITVNYKKPYYTILEDNSLEINDLSLLTETYLIDDGVNDMSLEITHTGTTTFTWYYNIFINGSSILSGGTPVAFATSSVISNKLTDTLKFGLDEDGAAYFSYDNGVDAPYEYTSSSSGGSFDSPTCSLEFDFDSGTTVLEYLEIEFENFFVDYELPTSTIAIEDVIYPLTTYLGLDTNHSITNFQDVEVIDAVQKGNQLFITTGTKFIAVRFVTLPDTQIVLVAQEVEQFAFEPNTQEVAIGGLNLIKSDPFLSIEDTTGGITFNPDFIRIKERYGVTNTYNILKCFVTLEGTETIASYDFKLEYQKTDSSDLTVWTTLQDFTIDDEGREIKILFEEPGTYNFRITMRETGDTSGDTDKYSFFYGYEVNSLNKNKGIDLVDINEQINNCLKIIQYYGKLILYSNETTNIYKSFGGEETWFTVSGVIPLNALRQEIVKKIIPLDNALVGFTENSIVALAGKGDDFAQDGLPFEPFSKFVTLDPNIGALAPESVVKTNDGRLIFLSNDGLYVAYNIDLSSEIVKTTKIDDDINNIVLRDETACAISYDNKYYLCYPDDNRIIKLHFVFNNIFSFDESSELVFRKMYVYDNTLYAISTLNKIMEHQKIVNTELENIESLSLSNQGLFIDDELVYVAEFQTKYYHFDYAQYIKKMFEFMIGFNSVQDEQVKLFINLFADNTAIISTDTNGEVITLDEDGYEIVSSYTRSEDDITLQEENIIGNTPVILGSWELDVNNLDFLAPSFRYFEIYESQEAMRFKLKLQHKQDCYLLVFSLGFVFDVGYIPKDNYRL